MSERKNRRTANRPWLCASINGKMSLHQREKEGIRILDLQGHLTTGNSEATLRTTIASLANANAVNIIVNLAGAITIDADGLGTLILCYTRIQRLGGALKLLHLDPDHLSLNALTKLNTVFEVFTDEQDAVNSFSRTARFGTTTFSNGSGCREKQTDPCFGISAIVVTY